MSMCWNEMDYVVVGIHVVWLGQCLSIKRFRSRNLSRARTTWPNDRHHNIARSPRPAAAKTRRALLEL